jgi:hypothetical protein
LTRREYSTDTEARQAPFCKKFHPASSYITHHSVNYNSAHTVKQTAKRLPVLGEGIFTMGYSKNYIMYWGVFTGIILPLVLPKVCTKFTKVIPHLLYMVYSTFSLFYLIPTKTV